MFQTSLYMISMPKSDKEINTQKTTRLGKKEIYNTKTEKQSLNIKSSTTETKRDSRYCVEQISFV